MPALAALAAVIAAFAALFAGARRLLNRPRRVGVAVIVDPEDHTRVDEEGGVHSVQAADLTSADQVLEVGPGLGALTQLLVERVPHVLAIEKDQRLVTRLIHGVFEQKSVVLITYEGFSRNGRSNRFELLALPLDGGVENPRCLGVVSAVEKPFWLGADPITDALIDSIRVIDPDKEPMFLKNRPEISVPSLAPTELEAPETISALGRSRRIRHLVVFEGGREG